MPFSRSANIKTKWQKKETLYFIPKMYCNSYSVSSIRWIAVNDSIKKKENLFSFFPTKRHSLIFRYTYLWEEMSFSWNIFSNFSGESKQFSLCVLCFVYSFTMENSTCTINLTASKRKSLLLFFVHQLLFDFQVIFRFFVCSYSYGSPNTHIRMKSMLVEIYVVPVRWSKY